MNQMISETDLIALGTTIVDWDRGKAPRFVEITITNRNNVFSSDDGLCRLSVHHTSHADTNSTNHLVKLHQESVRHAQWPGNFIPDEPILWTDNIVMPDGRVIKFIFDTPVSGFGVKVQTRNMGPFKASITAIATDNSQFTCGFIDGMATNKADGTALFLGLLMPNIKSLKIECDRGDQGFAINSPIIKI